jgi:O-antigen biosynthesis protein
MSGEERTSSLAPLCKHRSSGRTSRRAQSVAVLERQRLHSNFTRAGEGTFLGFVVDPSDLGRKFTVEIMVDGYPIKVIRADSYVHELAHEQIGDACYGFSLSIDEAFIRDSVVVEVRLANLGTPIGDPLVLDVTSETACDRDGPGELRWLGGLRFSGWIGPAEDGAAAENAAIADVLVDGTLVTQVRSSSWGYIGTAEDVRPVRTFDFHLPQRFADGVVHRLAVLTERGEHVRASPLPFLVFEDGLREMVVDHGNLAQEHVRAELFDRLMPMSVPFSRYGAWRERFPIAPGPSVPLQAAVVMVGPGAFDDTLESLNEQSHTDWVAACLPATPEPTGFSPELARGFLGKDAAQSDFVVFGLTGTLLAPAALQRIANALVAFESAIAIYGDVDLRSADGATWPLALPAFDYERMLEQGYCAHLFALRRKAAEQSLASGAANLYRLFNSVLDDESASAVNIVHLPGALGTLPAVDWRAASTDLADASQVHCRQRGIPADAVPGAGGVFPMVRISRVFQPPPTTIVIPTRNRGHRLEVCLESIRPLIERLPIEILVVDNDSTDPDTLDYVAEINGPVAKVLSVPGYFNLPRLNNRAAECATGDVLCLLNDDVKAQEDGWLDEVLSRIIDEEVGAVGALLVRPTGVVQHGGFVLGPNFAAAPAFIDRIVGDAGYGDLLCVAHECSAVTAACLVTRRRDYLGVGGMDEVRFPRSFYGIDYCLKLRALGKRIVLTPYVSLERSASTSDSAALEEQSERRNLRLKWGDALAADPYYSPLLSLDPVPYSALAWPARAAESRVNQSPIATSVLEGF